MVISSFWNFPEDMKSAVDISQRRLANPLVMILVMILTLKTHQSILANNTISKENFALMKLKKP